MNDYGYSKVYVYNATHIYWELMDTEKETVVDYVWIEKDKLRYYPSRADDE
jgi:hypothetical protein